MTLGLRAARTHPPTPDFEVDYLPIGTSPLEKDREFVISTLRGSGGKLPVFSTQRGHGKRGGSFAYFFTIGRASLTYTMYKRYLTKCVDSLKPPADGE